MNGKKWIGLINIFLCVILAFGFISSVFSKNVSAAGTVTASVAPWYDDDHKLVQVVLGDFPSGATATFRLNFNVNEVILNYTTGGTVTAGEGYFDVSVQVWQSPMTITIGVSYTSLENLTVSVSGVSSSGGTPTTTTTVPTTTTTRPAQTTARPASTTAATAAPVQPTTAQPTAAQPTAAQPQETTASAVDTTPAETTATSETSETIESSTDEELPPDGETTAETSDVDVVAPVEDTNDGDTDGEATPTPTRTPIAATVVKKDLDQKKAGFPWWVIILLVLLGAGGYRYYQLSSIDKVQGRELVYDFIPGGVIGNVAEKFFPTKKEVAPKADEPEVVNGYLKTSNTKTIRPMYSNIPGAREAAMASTATTTASKTVTGSAAGGAIPAVPKAAPKTAVPKAPVTTATAEAKKIELQQRPPIKRPKTLSSNRAVANAAAVAAAGTTARAIATPEETKASVGIKPVETPKAAPVEAPVSAPKEAAKITPVVPPKTATPANTATPPKENKVPLQQRPPIKRPSSLSSNRAAAGRPTSGGSGRATGKAPSNIGGEKLSNSGPTVAAQAFERAQSENKAKPAIANAAVPPVVNKSADKPAQSPFKQIKRPTNAVAAANRAANAARMNASTGVKAKGTSESYFIPMATEKKEEINPFKPSGAPAEEDKKMGVSEALVAKEKHSTFTATPYVEKEKVDPFKHPAPSASSSSTSRPFNAAAAMKELRAMEEADAAGATTEVVKEAPKSEGGLGGFLNKFKK